MLFSSKTILVTGANGFVGRALVKALSIKGYAVRAIVRSETALKSIESLKDQGHFENLCGYNIGELTEVAGLDQVLEGVHVVVHCAARAHVLKEKSKSPLALFRFVNCEVTKILVQRAQERGIKRFIFMSSIGVLGNSSGETPFNEQTPSNPQSDYAQAKWEAELALTQYRCEMETVIIRPPLVYGPGVKGNFEKLLNLVARRLPLPLGDVNNKRQFIGIDNLVDFILLCIESLKAANQIFVVADKNSISTTQLIKEISIIMGKKSILLKFSQKWLMWILKKANKLRLADQLLNNLEIDFNKSTNVLGWIPPYTFLEQLQNTVKGYKIKGIS